MNSHFLSDSDAVVAMSDEEESMKGEGVASGGEAVPGEEAAPRAPGFKVPSLPSSPAGQTFEDLTLFTFSFYVVLWIRLPRHIISCSISFSVQSCISI